MASPPAEHKYADGSTYKGDWNAAGLRHGTGELRLPDGCSYAGQFEAGLASGLGVLRFPDGACYEGEFTAGKFHGYGVFLRADRVTYKGLFNAGKMHGLGLLTFADGTHGVPRYEGFFEDGRFVRREKCLHSHTQASKSAERARGLRVLP